MLDINLLPKKYRSNDTMAKTFRGLKTLSIVATAVFFVAVMVIIGYIVINQTKIKDYQKKNASLESSLKSLARVESEYILLKERAKLFNSIYKSGAEGSVGNFESIFLGNDQVFFSRAQLSGSKNEVLLQTANSLSLGEFLKKLVSSNTYKKVVVSNFSFNPEGGYSLSLQLN
jgi:hypothetical protein